MSKQRVFVYFNLHKRVFSVRDVASGLVVQHVDNLTLKDVTFKVSEAGRQRVLRERRKNVHAGVLGVVSKQQKKLYNKRKVSYNPYKAPTFFYVDTGEPCLVASRVRLSVTDGVPSLYV